MPRVEPVTSTRASATSTTTPRLAAASIRSVSRSCWSLERSRRTTPSTRPARTRSLRLITALFDTAHRRLGRGGRRDVIAGLGPTPTVQRTAKVGQPHHSRRPRPSTEGRPVTLRSLTLSALVPVLVLPALTACGGGDDGPSITVYNAQHEQLLEELAPKFTEETGIEVELRNGKDLELSNQLVQEGDASPADVFLTENSPAMSQVEQAGLFEPLPDDARRRRSPSSTARRAGCGPASSPARRCWSTTPTWSTPPSCRPRSSTWPSPSGPGGSRSPRPAPTSRRSSPPCSTSRARTPPAPGSRASRPTAPSTTATTWCSRRSTPVSPRSGSSTTTTGTATWPRAATSATTAQLYFFGDQDPGAFVSVSGAGVLASSDPKSDAEKFVQFLVDETGPAGPGRQLRAGVPPQPRGRSSTRRSSRSPSSSRRQVNVSDLDAETVVDLMTEVGFL